MGSEDWWTGRARRGRRYSGGCALVLFGGTRPRLSQQHPDGTQPPDRRAHSVSDHRTGARRGDALEHPADGALRRRHAVAGTKGLARCRRQAPSAQDFQAEPGPEVRRESHRRGWALPQPTRQRTRALGRRGRRRSRPSTGPIRCSRCGPGRSRVAPTTTSGTAPRISMPPSMSPPARCSGASPGAIVQRSSGSSLRKSTGRRPPELALDLIIDNSSTHTTEAIRDFLAAHPRFHLHFTPTSASWLNAGETWFGQLERRALRRGVFTGVSELRRKSALS